MNRSPFNPQIPGLFDPSVSDLLRSQSFAKRNGIWSPSIREEDLLLRDVTMRDVSTTKHGFAPKLPNDATKYLDGTGAYSTPSGSGLTAAQNALGLDFFSDRSLLPATTFKQELYVWPAADFSNLNGATNTRNRSRSLITGGGSGWNYGWDIGSAKSTLLYIVGIRPAGTNMSAWIADTTPGATDLANGTYLAQFNSSSVTFYKRASGTYTSLSSQTGVAVPLSITGPSIMVAIYYEDSSNTILVFLRYGAEQWFNVLDFTDSSFTTMRYFGIQGSSTVAQWGVCPLALYHS